MGSDAARLAHSISPQPDPARTLPRLAELGASSSTRPSSLNVLLNPVLDDGQRHAAGQQREPRPTPTPPAWTAVNHPPRTSSVSEAHLASDCNQVPAQLQPQHQRPPSPCFYPHSGPRPTVNQEQGQIQGPAADTFSNQPTHDDSPSSADRGTLPSAEHPAITVVWGSPARSRPRPSRQRRHLQRIPLCIYARPHPAPPSPAPSPELEPPTVPSLSQFPASQLSDASGHCVSEAVAPDYTPASLQSQAFARPARIVRFSDQPNTMPMSPPPNPSAGALQQNLNATAAAHQVTPVSPSSPDACTRCYSIYLQQFHAAIQEHEHQSQQKQMSLSRNSSEEYNRFLEAGRASIADVRLHFDSVRQTCSVCAERPPEDSVENVKVAFRDVMPIRGLPAACAQSGKRKIDSEHVSNETESTSKSRRVSPEILLPALCESTPPPEPDGTPKFLLADVNDMFVGFYRPRPVDDFVPSGLLERTARSLGLATEKSTHVAARNDPPKGDWTNMFYDPVIDSGKMSEAGRLSLEEETGKPR